jgi:predicted MFS family arabinose efflux permease
MDRATFARLRRQPGYPLFFTTATITRFADDMFAVGTVLLVLDRTGSAPLAGAVVAAVTFPSIITGPVLGAWLDRARSRRRIMMLDQLIAASTIVALVALAGRAPDWTLPLVAICAGITWPLSFGGFTSLIPTLVPEDLLVPANAFEATSFNVAIIAGPALAGAISATAGPDVSLLVEAVLTVGATAMIARIPALDRPTEQPASRPLSEIVRAGLRHVASVAPLRSVTVGGAISLGGLGLLTVAFPFFAVDALGENRAAAGFLWAAFAAGSTFGAIALVRLQNAVRPHVLVFAAIASLGCLMLLWPLSTSLPMAMALIALAGMVDGPGFSAQFAVRQRYTPRELHGQVFTTAASLKVGSYAVGAAFAGPLVVALGAKGTLVVAACVQFVAVAVGYLLARSPTSAAGAVPQVRATRRLELQQDEDVDDERDREPDRPAVKVSLDQRSAAEWSAAGAADSERP